MEVRLGVHADAVVGRFCDEEIDAVFEQAKLLETLGDFQRAGWKLREAGERGWAGTRTSRGA